MRQAGASSGAFACRVRVRTRGVGVVPRALTETWDRSSLGVRLTRGAVVDSVVRAGLPEEVGEELCECLGHSFPGGLGTASARVRRCLGSGRQAMWLEWGSGQGAFASVFRAVGDRLF